jgi:septal ring factor EnvC (AmiA/AmiB activator)
MDYVNLKEIELQKQKLNMMFDEAEGQNDLTMRLTEMLKTKSEEYNQCINRIDKMLAKLNGERSKRIQNQHQRNASIISLVQLFQDEEERKLMIKMADMQKQSVRAEADEIEKMSDWKARVLGITKEDAI